MRIRHATARIGMLVAAGLAAGAFAAAIPANVTAVSHSSPAITGGSASVPEAALGRASVLTGLRATSAYAPLNTYWICQPDAYCIANTPHGDIWTMTTNPNDWGIFNFNSEYIASNGGTWWQIQENQSDLCLNWDPSNGWVYADSCPPGDPNELWSNHPGYQFDNLAAATHYRMDAWLTNAETGLLTVQASPVNLSIWGDVVPS